MAVVAGSGPSDDLAASIEQRLVAERVGIGDAVDFERDEPLRDAAGELLLERVLADEGTLLHPHETIEAGLERGVVGCHVATPHAVGLLHAQDSIARMPTMPIP